MLALTIALLAAPQRAPRPVITPTAPPPIVRTNTLPPPERVGSWYVSDLGDYTGAHTGNDSGSVFGVLCGKTCVVYLNFKKECEQGDPYAAMINSDSGAFSITLRCHHLDDRYILTTEFSTAYVDMLVKGGEVGFAIPLQGGQFSVSRFSLTGGLDAVGRASEMAKKKEAAGQTGLRDFTI